MACAAYAAYATYSTSPWAVHCRRRDDPRSRLGGDRRPLLTPQAEGESTEPGCRIAAAVVAPAAPAPASSLPPTSPTAASLFR